MSRLLCFLQGISPATQVESLHDLTCVYRYLDNLKATCNAFDDEGFFRTGDIVRYNGSAYEIEGRVECDCGYSGEFPSLFFFGYLQANPLCA